MRSNYQQNSIHNIDIIQTISAEVQATQQWVEEIIIGLNFCPFAKKEFVNNTIHYHRSALDQIKPALHEFIVQCQYLQVHDEIETTLIVFAEGFRHFDRYLDLVDYANDLLIDSGFEGVFQLATMHPEYCFAGDDIDSATNFTNRSPYPMLHIIREKSMEKVLSVYKDPEKIPEINIGVASQKGSQYFRDILTNIHQKFPQQ